MQTQPSSPALRVVRELVLIGEDADIARRGDKQLVAMSQCRFHCPDDDTLARCVDAIRRSDEHLRNRPEEMMLWDWQCTYVERDPDSGESGGTVILGVAWYDEAFFQSRREAHLDDMHCAMYEGIGIARGSISVTHWRHAGSYDL